MFEKMQINVLFNLNKLSKKYRKKKRLQVDEILNFFIFLVDGNLKFTYALSTFKVKVITYQSMKLKVYILTQFHQSSSKIIFTYF
jgi:hypothetical protein